MWKLHLWNELEHCGTHFGNWEIGIQRKQGFFGLSSQQKLRMDCGSSLGTGKWENLAIKEIDILDR